MFDAIPPSRDPEATMTERGAMLVSREEVALESITAATIRVRLQHSHTLKDGWRLSETTVEWNGDAAEIEWDRMAKAMRIAVNVGLAETVLRNEIERKADAD